MAKYYILTKAISTGVIELLETIEAKGLKEARRTASSKYISVITGGAHQLIVVGKAGYTQYYKESIKNETVDIIARVSGLDGERIALTEKDKETATRRLDKAFGKSKDGIWTDSFGQEFFIRAH